MNALSKAVVTQKENLYKKSAAEIAIGAGLLVIDDLLPYLFRMTASQVYDKDEVYAKAKDVVMSKEIQSAFLQGFAEIMNSYANEDGRNAIRKMQEELNERGINYIVGFKQ